MKLNKKGFTLVELLAVIVVIALLMVVLMGTMGNADTNAKKGALQTEAMKLVSNYETEQKSAVMIGETAKSSGKLTAGSDFEYVIKVNTEGVVTQYCVNYKDKFSVYGESTTGSAVPTEKPSVIEKGKSNYCTVSESSGVGTITKTS